MVLHSNKLESPSPKDALCQIWWKLALRFWRRRFLNFTNVFLLFGNYLPLERGKALQLNKLESSSLKEAMCQDWLKLVRGLEKKILKFRQCIFLLFRNYLPLEKDGALHFNKLESPLPKDALCQVWLKLAQWFWRRR